ncbi:MAG TPA: hypothetical protein ENG61_02405 [Candidatus Korarchaeota archaeon]|nr:MAG: hypothetical protein DRO05_07600 [Candidatus Korarchaeota archaeon]HDD69194.1 hypothetical protein [Candidatus Korarchaeota archaeon]
MKKSIALFLIATLIAPIVVLGINAQDQKVVGIDITPGRVKDLDSKWGQTNLRWLEGNLTAAGFQIKEITEITPESLKGCDALIIGKLYDYNSVFSDSEIQAIKNWFLEGGKFIWVGADSDYTEPYLNPDDISFKAGEPNRILEAIGSCLRLEYASLEDPTCNIGAAYRVKSYEANRQGWAAEITQGADVVMFHGPTFVIGFKNGQYVPFSEVEGPNVVWLYRSSPDGTVVSHDGVDPKAHSVGETGQFVEAAAEIINLGLFKPKGKVIVTGESLLGDRFIGTPEYHGEKLQGMTFIINAFKWGTRVEGPVLSMTMLIAIIVIIIIVVVAIVVLRRK